MVEIKKLSRIVPTNCANVEMGLVTDVLGEAGRGSHAEKGALLGHHQA